MTHYADLCRQVKVVRVLHVACVEHLTFKTIFEQVGATRMGKTPHLLNFQHFNFYGTPQTYLFCFRLIFDVTCRTYLGSSIWFCFVRKRIYITIRTIYGLGKLGRNKEHHSKRLYNHRLVMWISVFFFKTGAGAEMRRKKTYFISC